MGTAVIQAATTVVVSGVVLAVAVAGKTEPETAAGMVEVEADVMAAALEEARAALATVAVMVEAATMVATTSPAPSPRSSARTPALVADSVRLRSIERFARRKATEDRTNSPRRRAQVSDLRKHSVCGTGVAEKRRLGDASKAKIETLVAIGAQHPDAFGLPGASPGIRECADSVQGALYHSGSFENRGARKDYAANDRSSIARLGVGAEGVPDSHPAKPALTHLAPAARPLPLEPGWTLAGKEREAMQGAGSPSAIREEAEFAAAALPSGARRRLDHEERRIRGLQRRRRSNRRRRRSWRRCAAVAF